MSSAEEKTLLVTGATGFVGAALALELLRANPRARAYCLVRAATDAAAHARVHDALAAAAAAYAVPAREVPGILARTRAIRGDLTRSRLGVDCWDRALLARVGPLHVWHCAASLKDDEESLSEIIAHNLTGTERVVEFALGLNAAVFNHVSTAYVAGRTVGIAREQLERPRGFSNRYEQSKHYGEQLVVDHCRRARVPFRVLRPGIVIGHSVTGRATGYTGFLGWTLKVAQLDAMSGGALRKRPLRYVCRPDTELNLVPIDSIVEDCVGIDAAGARTHDRVFNLTNVAAPTVKWIAHAASEALGIAGVDCVADGTPLDPLSMRFHRWTRFERPYVRARKRFARTSNALYASPRHGYCPISKQLFCRMVRLAVDDYRRAAAQRKGAA